MTDQVDVIKKSVTADDYADSPRAGVFNFVIPMAMWSTGGMTPEAPAYWSKSRDQALRATILHEDFWAAAVTIAATKMAAKAFQVDSEVPLRSKRLQEMLLSTNWVRFIFMHLRDFHTTDNGAFVEVVRATSSPVSKVMGVVHGRSWGAARAALRTAVEKVGNPKARSFEFSSSRSPSVVSALRCGCWLSVVMCQDVVP